jgi:NarL family two-component system response regulator LiaR
MTAGFRLALAKGTGAQMPQPINLAVVNDYAVVANGFKVMLRPFESRVTVKPFVNSVPSARQAKVALFDTFGQPEVGRKLDALMAISGLKVIVYAWTLTQQEHAAAVRQGASGYLSKAATAEEVVTAVERVAAGEVVRGASSSVKRHMTDWPGKDAGLTPREAEVVALIGTGMTDEEVAQTLHLSVNSTRTHVRTAYACMGVVARPQAVRWALRHGLEQPPRLLVDASRVA